MSTLPHFHVTFSPPSTAPGYVDPWPKGAWSVYRITGDQIAKRIEFGPDGKATRRDSWCGYLGMWETLQEAADAIAESMRDSK